MSIAVECIHEARAGCGEGPIWDHRSGILWWVDIAGETIHSHHPASKENRQFDAPCLVSSLALAPESLLIASARGIAQLDTESGELSPLEHPEPGLSGNRLNDIIAGPDGALWVGTMSEGARGPTGALYRLDGAGTSTQMSGTTISNGLGFSPDGTRLYFIDSVPGLLYVREDDEWRVLHRFDETTGKPDGMTVDSNGTLWIAICNRGRVVSMEPSGTITSQFDLPCEIVTSCCFGGHDLSTLYITTGTFSMSEEEKAANPLAGGLFAARMAVPGLPAHEARWPH